MLNASCISGARSSSTVMILFFSSLGSPAFRYPEATPVGHHPSQNFCSRLFKVFLEVICDWSWFTPAITKSMKFPSGESDMPGWETDISSASCFFKQGFDLHVIESVSGQSIGVLNKDRTDGFVILDSKKHILESRPVHIRSRSR